MTYDLKSLTREQVDAALVESGYTDNQLIAVMYLRMNEHGEAMYETIFRNPDTDTGRDVGKVFIFVGDNGKLMGEF